MRRLAMLWVVTIGAATWVAEARGESRVPEYQVKAAFIYKFATYIRWPASAAGTGTATPFVIGIIGHDPFGSALQAVVRDERMHGRVILIRRLGQTEDPLQCDVIFISSSERGNLKQIIAALQGAPVLTVGDMDQFAEMGGMINLVTTEDRKIRFDINRGAIDRAGLKATSQLLRLARIVDEPRSGDD